MKKTAGFFCVGLGLTLTVNGAIFEFDLGPAGLNGANERPVVVTTATGGEIVGEPGITYNNLTKELFLNFGWGDANGYSDLQSSFTATHIHGPADVTTTAGVLYNLTTLVNQQTSTDGGVFQKVITLVDNPNNTTFTVAQQEQQLFDGLWYINVHTVANPGGEIRGQFQPVPVPEPQTYALLAGLSLLGFAGYRRLKTNHA